MLIDIVNQPVPLHLVDIMEEEDKVEVEPKVNRFQSFRSAPKKFVALILGSCACLFTSLFFFFFFYSFFFLFFLLYSFVLSHPERRVTNHSIWIHLLAAKVLGSLGQCGKRRPLTIPSLFRGPKGAVRWTQLTEVTVRLMLSPP